MQLGYSISTENTTLLGPLDPTDEETRTSQRYAVELKGSTLLEQFSAVSLGARQDSAETVQSESTAITDKDAATRHTTQLVYFK